ncbi:YebC/PmpR family DNA-binding transcriptional regulator [Mycoplasma sp. SG1]|uniref:YebC/PmpR family DNA-binding transcriptional regulator n=1 Tax=Mycoplasma sp. SG1 TaxID=2810348 RepID=UPI002025017B|nr:YebC/PmpR family DNA-binding transcriptional regulator [Mycoplasma sp. SG1]URM53112.1 YebC/PmpR family DNA-binding transcriptional regulator [Mycoplasma sp. SG1]
MSGHSKFSNIKHKKAIQDKKKSELFVNFAQQIRNACKKYNSSNLQFNPLLKNLIKSAQKAGMKKEKIENLLKTFDSESLTSKTENIYNAFYFNDFLFLVISNFSSQKAEVLQSLKKLLKSFKIRWVGTDSIHGLIRPSGYGLFDLNEVLRDDRDNLLLKLIDFGITEYYFYGIEDNYLEIFFNFSKQDELNILLNEFKNIKVIYLLDIFIHNIYQQIDQKSYDGIEQIFKILAKNKEVKLIHPNFKYKNISDLLIFASN